MSQIVVIWVPPTTIAIRSDILEYVRSRSRDWFHMDQLQQNCIPTMNSLGEANASGQHGIAACLIMIPGHEVRVVLSEEDL